MRCWRCVIPRPATKSPPRSQRSFRRTGRTVFGLSDVSPGRPSHNPDVRGDTDGLATVYCRTSTASDAIETMDYAAGVRRWRRWRRGASPAYPERRFRASRHRLLRSERRSTQWIANGVASKHF
jgi:hypothetical protein